MKKIADGIYAITVKLPFPATPELSVYFLDGATPALVDTGLGDDASIETMDSALAGVGRGLKGVSVIVNTHEHIEHFGGNRRIKDISAATAVAAESAAPYIEHFHDFIAGLREKQERSPSKSLDVLKPFINFNLTIDESGIERKVCEGDVIDLGAARLEVIETPGHAQGHICLYDAGRKYLYTGDHVISTGSTFVGYGWRELAQRSITGIFEERRPGTDNISLYLDSLRKLQSLDVELMLPAHGVPITDPGRKLEEEIRRKHARERRFLESLERRGELSLDEIVKDAYEVEDTNLLLLGASLGYLERLSNGGLIEARAGADTLHFRLR